MLQHRQRLDLEAGKLVIRHAGTEVALAPINDMIARPPDIVVTHHPAAQRSLRVAVVTETYPPEVNGVARTVASGGRLCVR